MVFQGVSDVLVSHDLLAAHNYHKMPFSTGYQPTGYQPTSTLSTESPKLHR